MEGEEDLLRELDLSLVVGGGLVGGLGVLVGVRSVNLLERAIRGGGRLLDVDDGSVVAVLGLGARGLVDDDPLRDLAVSLVDLQKKKCESAR